MQTSRDDDYHDNDSPSSVRTQKTDRPTTHTWREENANAIGASYRFILVISEYWSTTGCRAVIEKQATIVVRELWMFK